jgi:hypothetical protein
MHQPYGSHWNGHEGNKDGAHNNRIDTFLTIGSRQGDKVGNDVAREYAPNFGAVFRTS